LPLLVRNNMSNPKKWYQSWFNTPYYHILYNNRDQSEAENFIKNLVSYFDISPDKRVLDLACGKGRHSIFLSSLGYDVLGVDLSNQNIAEAEKYSNPNLKFRVHDMRDPLPSKFDAIFNLFTSFGYFESSSDDIKVLNSIRQSLNKDGFGVIDFMNIDHVVQNLVPESRLSFQGIDFDISRKFDGQSIIKTIQVNDGGRVLNFEENVRAYRLEDFKNMLTSNGLRVLKSFGNYNLHPYDRSVSKRLILAFTIQQ